MRQLMKVYTISFFKLFAFSCQVLAANFQIRLAASRAGSTKRSDSASRLLLPCACPP